MPEGSKASRAILWGGLTAGALDITAAFILSSLRGVSPVRVLHSVASGLLGAASFDGGAATAALGAVLHFLIALGAAAVYYAASRKLTWMVRRPVASGLLYGVAVYLFMNAVVLPLSAIAFKPSYTLRPIATGTVVLMVCVGLPIALAVRRFSPAVAAADELPKRR